MATADRVVWYPVEAAEVVEFALDGQIRARYPIAPRGPKQAFAGAALCSEGGLFTGRETHGKEGSAELWEVLALDRASRTWRVAGNAPKSRWGWIYGCEGERLVTLSGRTRNRRWNWTSGRWRCANQGWRFQYSSAGPLITSKRSRAARARMASMRSGGSGWKFCATRTSSSSCPCVEKPSTAACTGRLKV